LVNSANAFDCADVESVLAPEISWMCSFDLAVGKIIVFIFLKQLPRALVKTIPDLADSFSTACNRNLKLWRLCRSPIERTPEGETKVPSLRSSLLALVCPYAGKPTAKATTAVFDSRINSVFQIRLAPIVIKQNLNATVSLAAWYR